MVSPPRPVLCRSCAVIAAEHHIAQVNIALPAQPLDTPLLAEFVAALDPVNAIADASPGFVWRLQTENGWIPAGQLPAVGDAEQRVRHLREHGPTPHAFTFRTPFPAPGRPAARASIAGERTLCPSG